MNAVHTFLNGIPESKFQKNFYEWRFDVTSKKNPSLIPTLINVTIHFFVLVLLFFRKMTGVCQTHVTKRGITPRNFNVPTLFYALSTGLELPYMHVFVLGREMELYVRPKYSYSSFVSTFVTTTEKITIWADYNLMTKKFKVQKILIHGAFKK